MRLSIIHPTITGREESLERMLEAYRQRTDGFDVEYITVKDFPNWPAGVNAGSKLASGDVWFYGADDVEPLEGWADAMMRTISAGEVPAGYYWDHPQGAVEPCGYTPSGAPVNAVDGPPGSVPVFSRGPALTRALAERVGPWPEIDYYADNWVSDKVRTLGVEVRMTAGMHFVHHWHPVGRLDHGNWVARNKPLYNAERAKLGLGPI